MDEIGRRLLAENGRFPPKSSVPSSKTARRGIRKNRLNGEGLTTVCIGFFFGDFQGSMVDYVYFLPHV
ncbi:MAG: hypothetical protein M5U34_41775 [Chloroflexi bacterium]|nr:hypothetical protein [Chloroflexota bacterium]